MRCDPVKIHIAHADPVVNTGLLAILKSEAGLDLTTGDPPAPCGTAVIVADYHGGLGLCRGSDGGMGMHDKRILIVTHHAGAWDVQRATAGGVHGYVLQSDVPDELQDAVRTLAAGGRYRSRGLQRACPGRDGAMEPLTGREREVLQLLGLGYCNKLIARELGISLGTVKNHMKAVLMKLNVSARTHAVIVAAQRGLLHIDAVAAGLR